MSNQSLRVVADNPYQEVITPETHPLRHSNNQQVAQEQWDQIAHNLPVGEAVSFTETTTHTRTLTRGTATQPTHIQGPATASDWVLVAVIIGAVVGVVVSLLILIGSVL